MNIKIAKAIRSMLNGIFDAEEQDKHLHQQTLNAFIDGYVISIIDTQRENNNAQ